MTKLTVKLGCLPVIQQKFDVPWKFLGEPDVILLVCKGHKRGHAEGHAEGYNKAMCKFMKMVEEHSEGEQATQMTTEAIQMTTEATQMTTEAITDPVPTELISSAPMLPGVEPNRNERLILWIKEKVGSNFAVMRGKLDPSEPRLSTYKGKACYISRFSRSSEDFGFYNLDEIGSEPSGAHIHAAREREILTASSGDSKDESKITDKYQLIANVVKTAADLGF